MTPYPQRAFVFVGRSIQILAALALLGWLQGHDPDCVLDTSMLVQLRMCSPEIAGEPGFPPLLRLGIILFAFCLGSFLARRRKKSDLSS